MKKIIKYGNGGRVAPRTPSAREREVTPIYVSDPNDPKLKSYNDSLYNYNIGLKMTSVLDKDKNFLKVKPGSKYDIALNKKFNLNKGKFEDNSDYESNGYENFEVINNILKEYRTKGNKGILPIRLQGYYPNPDNISIDLITARPFLDAMGITNPRPPGAAHIPQWKKPMQPVVYKPGTTEAQAFNNSETVNITPNGDFRFQPGGVFYDAPPTPKLTHPTTPHMNKIPMRGMPDINVNSEPIKVADRKASVEIPARFFMDMRGEWMDTPAVNYPYTNAQLEKMGYRMFNPNKSASKSTINSHKKGGEVKNEFNGNVYDAMGMYGFGGNVLNFAATNPMIPMAAGLIGGPIAGMVASGLQQGVNQFGIVPKKAEGGTADQTIINVEGGELEVTPSGKIVKEFINKPKHPAYGMDQNGNTMSTVGNIIIPKLGKLGADNFKNGDDITKRSIIRSLKFRQSKREGTSKFRFGGENKASIFKNVDPEIIDPFYGENISLMPSRRNDTTVQLDSPQYTYNDNTQGMKPLNIPFEKTKPQSQWSQLTGGQKLNYGLGQLGTYGPALYNLGRSIFDKPYQAKMSDYQVNPDVKFDTLKGNAGRTDMRNYYNSARTSIRNIGSGSAQLQGQIALVNKLFESTGKFNEDLENRNKLGIFEASRFNKGIQQNNSQMRYQVDMLNEQSRANQRNFGSTAVGQLSDIMQNQRNNNLMMGMLQSNYPGFNINKYTGVGSYNQLNNAIPTTSPVTSYNPNSTNTLAFDTMRKNFFKIR